VIPQDQAGPPWDGGPADLPDADAEETAEWLDSLDGLIRDGGPNRARQVLLRLLERSRQRQISLPPLTATDFVNTVSAQDTPPYPGDGDLERGFRRLLRWNASVLVCRAQRRGVGGDLAGFTSATALYEVGWHHFFRGPDHPGGGDQVYFQAAAAPGVYARAYLEGRLAADDLDGFRQQRSHLVAGTARGLPSYPHPRQLPDFWQFPTASLGLGPLNAVYQASFNRYLQHRGLKDTSQQRVWAFVGDGEMDEPEARGAIHLAARQGLDNLVFVVNGNLQRRDGPVRGNGKVIQELEGLFRGAGWNVVKVVWSSAWDRLFAADTAGALVGLLNTVPDGDFQSHAGKDGAGLREHLFGRDPRAAALVAGWTDAELRQLTRGGHDWPKVYAAYQRAVETAGAPTAVLAHTSKDHFPGARSAAPAAAPPPTRLTLAGLKDLRDRLELPIPDAKLEADPDLPPYWHPGPQDPSVAYALERRRALGGFVPERRRGPARITLPSVRAYTAPRAGWGNQPMATTTAWVRLLQDLMREPGFGERIVPIIPDGARAFGLDALFPNSKIYNPHGQAYTPADSGPAPAYREAAAGQIIHTGVDEAGAVAAFTAAGSSYATHGVAMAPVCVFASMFGFQRAGDGLWAAADQLARGFLIGAAAGKTTPAGEGLQHMDGHSPLLAAANPAVRHYDPAYAYELAHLMRHGVETMFGDQPEDVVFYLTLYDEPVAQPREPEGLDVDGVRRGMYLLRPADQRGLGPEAPRVQLLASGVAVPWALEAQHLLRRDGAVLADVWSVTSWNELRRDAVAADAAVMAGGAPRTPYVVRRLQGRPGPVIGVSDFARAVPDQIAPWAPGDYSALGGDGFGFSDTRAAARRWLKVDAPSITVKALQMLAARGELDPALPGQAFAHYRLDRIESSPAEDGDDS
jgi:pyruvate dehydrogenase E1 component